MYKLIPLLQLKGKLTGNIANPKKAKQQLKNFFVIIKEKNKKKSIIKVSPVGETIMFHKTQKKIGVSYFKIDTKLTPESTHQEITEAIKIFQTAFYKEKSKRTFKEIKAL